VIVAEIQANGDELSALSTPQTRPTTQAPCHRRQRNNGPNAGTVNSPANAQKALGIGAVDVKTQTTPGYQSRGPAADGRYKPDLQAPTNVETASSSSDTATQVFTGTSCATPHAAGAAAAGPQLPARQHLRYRPGPGLLVPDRQRSVAWPFDNTTGAGLVKLSVNGSFWRGSATVGNLQTIDIPISVGATSNRINVGLWWPEAPATHNDVDLSLVDPNGVVRASSVSG